MEGMFLPAPFCLICGRNAIEVSEVRREGHQPTDRTSPEAPRIRCSNCGSQYREVVYYDAIPEVRGLLPDEDPVDTEGGPDDPGPPIAEGFHLVTVAPGVQVLREDDAMRDLRIHVTGLEAQIVSLQASANTLDLNLHQCRVDLRSKEDELRGWIKRAAVMCEPCESCDECCGWRPVEGADVPCPHCVAIDAEEERVTMSDTLTRAQARGTELLERARKAETERDAYSAEATAYQERALRAEALARDQAEQLAIHDHGTEQQCALFDEGREAVATLEAAKPLIDAALQCAQGQTGSHTLLARVADAYHNASIGKD